MTASINGPTRIAYLLSQYPAISHTFFLNEILLLRERGFLIETASINSIHPPSGGFPEVEMQEAARTFYIKETRKTAIFKTLLRTLICRPGVIVRGASAAFRLRPLDIRGMTYAAFYLIEAILLGEWMRRTGCTHLHIHFGGSVATVGMLTSIAWEVPYSLTIHGPEEFYEVDSLFLKQKLLRAKFITCISSFCRSQVFKIVPSGSWGKVEICRLGVRTEVFLPPSEKCQNVFHIVSVGRLHPAKGQMILLGAINELLASGLELRLSIVGDGDGRRSLEDFIAVHDIAESVTLCGALSHPATRELLAAADLFVLPSFAEGVPVALMEAMSMCIACISTYVAGIPELIEPGVQGLLIPPSSQPDLTEAIACLLTDSNRRVALAAAGRAKVLKNYDLKTNIEILADVFEKYGVKRCSASTSGEPTSQSEFADRSTREILVN